MRYGMVIDLEKCWGCQSCTVACEAENFVSPGVFFNRVLVEEIGKYPSAKMQFVPVQCNHCVDAACVKVCPTGATRKEEDGIVTIDPNKCIGCRYCIVACPYRIRFFLSKKETYTPDASPHEQMGSRARDYQEGTVIKCDFCADKVRQGLEPACVSTCVGRARFFGDLDDPTSEVSRLIATRGGTQLLVEKGTDPSIFYLR